MKILALLIMLSSCAWAQGNNAPKPTVRSVKVVMPRKPTTDDKNPDGTPAYKTYEDFVEALAGWKVQQVMASLAHVPAVTIEQSSDGALEKKIATLESRLNFDEFLLSSKQDKQSEVALDPARMNVYQRIDSDPLQFLISLSSINPYLNGYKAIVDVGNPSTAHFKGVKIKCEWSKPYDWSKYTEGSYKAWKSVIHSSITDVSNDISPGSWNPVEIILLPATQEELGYFQVSIESNSVSLSNN